MLLFSRIIALSSVLSLASLAACASLSDEAATDDAALSSDGLGEELEQNEAALVDQIARAAASQVEKSKSETGKAQRDAHPKAHGCVTGSFTVSSQVPADLAVGTFRPDRHYDAWIRFSNGSKDDDREKDARGMAIKLLGVDGPRLLTGEEPTAHTHDIVLSNHHTFFLKDVSTYVKFMNQVVEKGNPLKFFVSLNPLDWHLREAILAREFTSQKISSPLTSQYWSVTPYKLGNQAVKYSMRPCAGADTDGKHADDPNYLSTALKDGLRNDGACFEFMIQRRTDARRMPVEDVTKTWDEDDSPFEPIARLEIPPQTFDSPEQQKFCENLSFTPWHGTPDHRPLGRINRTRKVVYEATSAARHRLNGVRRDEPTDLVVR
ncbi:MAG TPA: catalase family protein [Labilithrix sp.]|nr:catalase family protein [Labilithrix sp.]